MSVTLQADSVASWRGRPRLGPGLSERESAHVPMGAMLDFSFGGLDEELMQRLYGSHLDTCGACADAISVYRRQRPEDPARLVDIPEFCGQRSTSEHYPLSFEQAGARFKEFVSSGPGDLLIVAGEANPAVYNDAMGDVFRARALSAKRAGMAVPRIICGPAMGLDARVAAPESTLLPALAEEGTVQLYITEHRQKLHFRVSGDEYVYTEEYHQAGNPSERRGYWYHSRPVAGLFRRRFQAILDAGVARPARRGDFVYFRMDTIRRIEQAVGGRFDAMTGEEVAAAAARLS